MRVILEIARYPEHVEPIVLAKLAEAGLRDIRIMPNLHCAAGETTDLEALRKLSFVLRVEADRKFTTSGSIG